MAAERLRVRSDPSEHERLLAAARTLVRARGGAGLTLSDILSEAGLGTRSFYRCFASKDDLIAELFTESAAREARRLKHRTTAAIGALEGVVAWIDGRLELAFDRRVAADLQQMSLVAQSLRATMPTTMHRAFDGMLEPLVEQIRQGQAAGTFAAIDASDYARSIHSVVWSAVERKWEGALVDRASVREHVLRFCLPALGIRAADVDRVVAYASIRSSRKAG